MNPCPFCGHTHIRLEPGALLGYAWCPNCHARGPSVPLDHDEDGEVVWSEAIRLWNERAASEES